MDNQPAETLVVATYDVDVTARADGDVVRSGEKVKVPTNAEISAEIVAALALMWPYLTFTARSELTSK